MSKRRVRRAPVRQVRAPRRPSARVVRFPPADQGSAPTPPVDTPILTETGASITTESGTDLLTE